MRFISRLSTNAALSGTVRPARTLSQWPLAAACSQSRSFILPSTFRTRRPALPVSPVCARPLLAARGHATSSPMTSTEKTATAASTCKPSSIYFTITDSTDGLDGILALLRSLNISLTRIESRPSKTKGDYDFYIDFMAKDDAHVSAALNSIAKLAKAVKSVSSGTSDTDSADGTVPWFPRKIADLDSFAERVLSYGEELDADHPGFTDLVYRERRSAITDSAKRHKHGQPLPRVEYSEKEVKTWGIVFNKLMELYKTHACQEHQYIFPLLIQNCGYNEHNIPQIDDISKFLKDCTGWTMRPVMGLLSSRDFLNALAFRVFHSTQYIRHHTAPFYTPEPDVCHELLGHVPLYADPDFAAFSQEIGLASLGASDEDLSKLATIYWFTVEFGICRQNGELKAYGAGLLSSFGELEYSLSNKPKHLPFDCERMGVQKYPITEYQPVYFVADSFLQMKNDVREYTTTLKRPFTVHYNALTESIEILDNKEHIMRFASGVKSDLTRLISAIDKVIRE
ncbi:hypothetical protein BASA50_005559 [Batrachochytrium salamandrivorans]|uniref:phenylalanine 4-monooxygenase n=1 Tax=Batrachochytrium salamandrivorans TaxID=1357716 RepID=A0ABQ8FDP8_9FUNG|nr:hypothetical protein BASA60_006972 [Batrachochytrium salamandrivorans]KAH6577485.1 hypothetical protein BASA62_000862 [Batrachochytrium salamandrivorans]KAH6581575.1 hypothetical protein BASA61_008994 [Batrachochytrium salamandrivorans]KAH6595832.1 hypothetical protein BASA50_005559 [Batrachochytrium salamandrivorans]KAH9270806.1 hypothetical protein BASA83_006957 [Batrachochytrium salamandrivorans]